MPLVYRRTEVITVSPSSKEEIISHKLTKKTPYIVYNGVDLTQYQPGKKSKTPLLLYVGRLTTAKSIHILLSAFVQTLQAVPTATLVIAGDGPNRQKLEKLSTKLGLTSQVTFLGKVSEDEKIKLYQKAWVFINPSLLEGWGITTIEANACGTPVIASNVPGLRDAVVDGQSGILVPYGNIQALTMTLTLLISNTKLRQKLSTGAAKLAQNYDWNKSAKHALLHLAGKLL